MSDETGNQQHPVVALAPAPPCQHFWQAGPIVERVSLDVQGGEVRGYIRFKVLLIICAHCSRLEDRYLPFGLEPLP